MLKIKSQILNFKNYKPKSLGRWLFCIWFGIWCLVIGIYTTAYALNLDKLKICFLEGDYKSAILEGEKILANSSHTAYSDELYYLLGLSYLKDGNYLRASDIFEIILGEFKDSRFQEEARLGLGDTYFLRGEYAQAGKNYQRLLDICSNTRLRAAVYYRLSQIALKLGNTQEAAEYLSKLRQQFPLNPEIKMNQDLGALKEIYYSVQVGSFVSLPNAKNLSNKLINKGYDAYLQEADADSKKIYRIRVGRLKTHAEAVQLENKLSAEGYPTKIIP